MLEFLLPEMAQAWKSSEDDAEAKRRIERFWAYLRALDESIVARDQPPSDAMILATLLLPPLRDALSPDAVPVHNMAKVVADSAQPVLDRLKASRRDSELCRQILLTLRYLLPSNRPVRQRARLARQLARLQANPVRLHQWVIGTEILFRGESVRLEVGTNLETDHRRQPSPPQRRHESYGPS